MFHKVKLILEMIATLNENRIFTYHQITQIFNKDSMCVCYAKEKCDYF
jgi:hypothetical protein